MSSQQEDIVIDDPWEAFMADIPMRMPGDSEFDDDFDDDSDDDSDGESDIWTTDDDELEAEELVAEYPNFMPYIKQDRGLTWSKYFKIKTSDII